MMGSSSLEESSSDESKLGAKNKGSGWLRCGLIVVSFFFAVASLVPTAYGRMLVIWPALSPNGVIIAVLSTWMALRTLIMKNEPFLRWTAGGTLLLWLPYWIDIVPLVVSHFRDPWRMVLEGLGL